MISQQLKAHRKKILSVAKFRDLLQGARGGSKLRVFAHACAISALSS